MASAGEQVRVFLQKITPVVLCYSKYQFLFSGKSIRTAMSYSARYMACGGGPVQRQALYMACGGGLVQQQALYMACSTMEHEDML